jgi:hypothetical protein
MSEEYIAISTIIYHNIVNWITTIEFCSYASPQITRVWDINEYF